MLALQNVPTEPCHTPIFLYTKRLMGRENAFRRLTYDIGGGMNFHIYFLRIFYPSRILV